MTAVQVAAVHILATMGEVVVVVVAVVVVRRK